MAQQDQTVHSSDAAKSGSGLHLPHLPHYHAHPTPQYAAGNSNPGTPKSGPNSGRATPKHDHPHPHMHHTPQYFAGGPHHDPHPTAEQNAANLAKYNNDHAAQLALNRQLHGGHAEGDEYTPSRGAHHHPHLPHYHMHKSPQFYSSSHATDDGRKPASGANTPKEEKPKVAT